MVGVILVRNELIRRRDGLREELATARQDMPRDGWFVRLFWLHYIWSVRGWLLQADRNIRQHDSFWEN